MTLPFLNREKQSGFTLIEIIVVIAIIGILTSIALVNSGKNADRDVRLEADRLTTFIRNVQNKALTGEKVAGASGKICGFGVTIPDATHIQSYYVDTGAGNLDTDCATLTTSSGTNYADVFSPQINGVSLDFKSADLNVATRLFFLVPSGQSYLYDSSGHSLKLPAIFTLSKDVQNAYIFIGYSGNVY